MTDKLLTAYLINETIENKLPEDYSLFYVGENRWNIYWRDVFLGEMVKKVYGTDVQFAVQTKYGEYLSRTINPFYPISIHDQVSMALGGLFEYVIKMNQLGCNCRGCELQRLVLPL